jgi:hypothetical protein
LAIFIYLVQIEAFRDAHWWFEYSTGVGFCGTTLHTLLVELWGHKQGTAIYGAAHLLGNKVSGLGFLSKPWLISGTTEAKQYCFSKTTL